MPSNIGFESDLGDAARPSAAKLALGCKVMVPEIPDDPHPRGVAIDGFCLLWACFVSSWQPHSSLAG
jgi:hypothetical protein